MAELNVPSDDRKLGIWVKGCINGLCKREIDTTTSKEVQSLADPTPVLGAYLT